MALALIENCAFCVILGVLLGLIVCHDGLLVDPQNITTITVMPTPTNVMEINDSWEWLVFIDIISKILQGNTNVKFTKEG
jgi:hypothetical protein